MPRKKLIRRFEPRYGVSREMIDLEAKYVAREVEDFQLLAQNDLRERLDKVRQAWKQADETLERHVCVLPEHQKLAVQCIVVRDLCHLMELYCASLKVSVLADAATHPAASRPQSPTPPNEPVKEKMLPFSNWLFES